jgi:hypothetical protein
MQYFASGLVKFELQRHLTWDGCSTYNNKSKQKPCAHAGRSLSGGEGQTSVNGFKRFNLIMLR